ncbi:MAG: RHS repeat-associated core domain-containing protein [Methylibium sp.]|nr:RHS repeat-associated core domain-containing protein [Methylibium sp.]
MRIINGATTNTYNYLINGINLRVRKTGPSTVVPQGTQIFVYDDAAKLIGEYDNLGRARIEHVWLDDRPIAAITYTYTGTATTPTATTTNYVESDHLATLRLITNASRQKRWSWESAPYGDTLPNQNPQSLGAYKYNLRFPGQYFDSETNHHYNHHRDYESTTGRYVQSDPIGLEAGVSMYS